MNVLLCTPFGQGLTIAQGGIVVWARNIVEYSSKATDDVKIEVVPFDRKTHVCNDMGLLRRLWCGLIEYSGAIKAAKKCLRKEKYDVLHLCTSASISLLKDILVLKKAKREGVRTAIHFHFGRIPDVAKEKGWEWKLLERTIRLADVAITMDAQSYKYLTEAGFANIHYLPNPLSESIMKQVEEEAGIIRRIPNKILFVGHVIPSKGVFELIEACKEIKGVDLHIVGRASQEIITEMKRKASHGNWLAFEGEKTHNEVIKAMLSSQLFVLPSYTEGFPNVILEAMACGCAIVATDVGAIPEMLEDQDGEKFGLIVKPKNTDQLKSAIEEMLNNQQLKQECRVNAKRRVEERYSMPQVWNQMTNIWNSL